MPGGVSTKTYVKFLTAALASMALGSQTVHSYYKPLADLEDLVKKAEDKVLPEEAKEVLKKNSQN